MDQNDRELRCRWLARGRDEEDTKEPPNSLLFRGVWKGIGEQQQGSGGPVRKHRLISRI